MALMKRCFCTGSEDDFKEILGEKNIQLFSYREIRAATNKFDHDGTAFDAKVLSAESEQGIGEFLIEIESITEAKHANLVRLLGCCFQRQNRILIYEYVENNSLEHALQTLGSAAGVADLSWSTRSDICMGIAKGLTYLHEEHKPNIVHRDIKAGNILLDRNYSPKIGDFGLAKLFPDNVTHISTRVVGTTGYLAPEYVVHGQLTKKADVYSFGVLILEIISGRRISQTIRSDMFLVQQAWVLYQQAVAKLALGSSEAAKRAVMVECSCGDEASDRLRNCFQHGSTLVPVHQVATNRKMALMKRCFCTGSEDDFKEILGEKNIQLFSYREIRASTNKFDHGNKLGRGGFGTVYKIKMEKLGENKEPEEDKGFGSEFSRRNTEDGEKLR
ncbi:hypothetical protein GUJ93_ZPchr0002g26146 [Zizania palustris]|uniref:Protein kinase domain-containing protein n=1 Tax=Zizania palustris TaxID=103762 RepID=A0A8J5VWJ6_ZIZPA|nr:hypothetical protein GUJ93_ZPchr0002g26146 [Zizania palustris]